MDDLPLVGISWEDASAYCEANWGRLPSEAEWEYAARAGHEGWKYVWGKDATPLKDGRPLANLMDLSVPFTEGLNVMTEGFEGYRDGYAYVAPVGSFLPNAFGIHDLGGNVSEWVQDQWSETYAGAPEDGSAQTGTGRFHIRATRGGSWLSGRRQARVSSRGQGGHGDATGFRCVLDPD
jgi:formylglycine-generating enzyme required for sulfatase activity